MRMRADDRRDRAQPHLVGKHPFALRRLGDVFAAPMDEGDDRPVGVRAHEPVEQRRRQQVGLRRAVGVDVGEADDVEARQRQHVALPEPRYAGGGRALGWSRHSPKAPRSMAWLLARPTAATLQPLQPGRRQFLRHGERHVVDRLRHVGQDHAFQVDDQRPRFGAGEDLVRDAVGDLLVEQDLLHRAAEIHVAGKIVGLAPRRAAGRCSRVRTRRTGSRYSWSSPGSVVAANSAASSRWR